MSSLKEEQMEAVKKQRVLSLAQTEAFKYGAVAMALVGGATFAATLYSKKFDKMMSLSAKVSFPVMAGLGIWSYRYEIISIDAKRFPEKYGIYSDDHVHTIVARPTATMPFHHQVMNYIYDHPFQMIASLGIPLTATILHSQRLNTHLTLSQKIMHSRVFAQGGVLCILLTTMGFREYIFKRGRFKDPAAAPTKNSENSQ
jgi:hypothetical protein